MSLPTFRAPFHALLLAGTVGGTAALLGPGSPQHSVPRLSALSMKLESIKLNDV